MVRQQMKCNCQPLLLTATAAQLRLSSSQLARSITFAGTHLFHHFFCHRQCGRRARASFYIYFSLLLLMGFFAARSLLSFDMTVLSPRATLSDPHPHCVCVCALCIRSPRRPFAALETSQLHEIIFFHYIFMYIIRWSAKARSSRLGQK